MKKLYANDRKYAKPGEKKYYIGPPDLLDRPFPPEPACISMHRKEAF